MIRKLWHDNKNIILNILGAFGVKGGALLISVLLLPAYLRFFEDQAVLGIWYTILSVLNWVIIFDLGLGQGLRNQLPAAIENRDHQTIKACVSTTYILMFLLSAGLYLVGSLLIPVVRWNSVFHVAEAAVSNDTLRKCVQIIFGGIMLQMVLKIITSILYAYQKSAFVNVLSLASNVLIYVFLLITPSGDVSSNLLTMAYANVVAANLPYVICTVIVFSTFLKNALPAVKAFSKKYVKGIFNVGMTLLWLQIVFMVVSSVNEFLITSFSGPEYVVEYQAYYKIFKTAAMMVSLALTPIWSAVTRAQAQKNYRWISKVYKVFLAFAGVCFLGELCIIPLLQWVFDIWLGQGVMTMRLGYAVAFVCSSVIFVLHSINTSIGNGMSYFRIQTIWMTVAAVLFVPLAYVFVQITGSWIGVVIANVLAMLPYEILAPVFTMRHIKKQF